MLLTLAHMNELKKLRTTKQLLLTSLLIYLAILPVFLKGESPSSKKFKVMFYNVENLFDIEDDPQTLDNEFLPEGERFWNERKFYLKLQRIYQVIVAAGEWTQPTVIGLCEIENRNALESLLHHTPLGKMGYRIIQQESPDRRGIDVALLYREDQFQPISFKAVHVKNPQDKNFKTRDILYVKGSIESDTLHFFVNHWPSKYGGVVETKPLRALAARTLRTISDSILSTNKYSKIIIMGDFNDSPFDESITQHLKAKTTFDTISSIDLYNLSFQTASKGIGSNKYQGKWELIDQFFVSGSLITPKKKLSTKQESFNVFDADFLLEDDKNYLGKKPFRTYTGFKYNNGFSDHLPVTIDLFLTEN
jgi:endonuclease/exonuclease/phosphatase family metal-dependent hydrolase